MALSLAAGLRTQYERTEVAGFGERTSAWKSASGSDAAEPGKPVQIGTVDFSDKKIILEKLSEVQKIAVNLPYEINCTITSDGKVWLVKGSEGIVHPETIPSSLAGSYAYHNHPKAATRYSFSAEDVRFFFQQKEVYSKASDHVYEYVIQRTADTLLAVDSEMVYHRFKEIESTTVAQMKWDRLINPDMDGFHETMKILSRELKFFYERKESR